MAIYAVRHGKKKGKYYTWKDCAKQVIGVSGVEYQKFETEEEADRYLGVVKHSSHVGLTPVTFIDNNRNCKKAVENTIEALPEQLKDGEAIAYIDGSFDGSAYSFACIFVTKQGKQIISGMDTNEELMSMRNVAGELAAAMVAVKTAKELGVSQLTLVYDYVGVANWVHGTWTPKTELLRAYKQYMQDYLKTVPVFFKWVKGHSGFPAGDRADWFAKDAIKQKKRYNTSKLFEGYYSFEGAVNAVRTVASPQLALA